MSIIFTNWALQSYLDLKKNAVIADQEYWKKLRPDALLLNNLKNEPKFQNTGFWGPAKDLGGALIQHGYKMKWHNIGPGGVQLRLTVVLKDDDSFLCHAYVKDNTSKDFREMAKLKARIPDIYRGRYDHRGYLS